MALTWFAKAAELGHLNAYSRIADIYEKGFSERFCCIPPFPERAMAWREFQKCPSFGNPIGAYGRALAELQLFIASGFEKKGKSYLGEACKWYLPLAKNGRAEAQYGMGRILKNTPEAEKWYMAAGLQGHLDAQYELGLLYYLKSVTNPTFSNPAFNFLTTAAAKGHAKAQFTLGNLYSPRKDIAKYGSSAVA